MTMLTKIGNSQGIRIPKPLIKQAKLENVEIELKILKEGLLLKPVKNRVRKDWEEDIKKVLRNNKYKNDEGILNDFLNDDDLSEWEW